MNYCSIQDAWGNQFNEIDSNNEESDEESSNDYYENSYEDSYKKTNDNVVPANSYINKLKELKKKEDKLKLYKKKLIKIEEKQKIEKLKKNQKESQLKTNMNGGGFTNLDSNHSILLGLLLLFIVDFFGNLSY